MNLSTSSLAWLRWWGAPVAALVLAGALPAQAQSPWRLLGSGPNVATMYRHGMAYDASRDRTVLYGGKACTVVNNQTWEWDGTAWQQMSPAVSPRFRTSTDMVYDPHRQRVVIFGGIQLGLDANDLWEWDGTTWTERVTELRPPARRSHAMAYDEARRCIVVFGGRNISAVRYDDTWLWDGTSWQEAKPDTRPLRRSQHAMAYDPLRQRVVMFGGVTDDNGFQRASDDTWEWDGTNWVLRQPSVRPPPRPSMAMTYDYQRRQIIVFGGSSGIPNQPFADTWGWDGQQWTLIDPGGGPGAPAGRQDHAMAYDSRRGRVLMNGGQIVGQISNACYRDFWALDNPTPGFSGFGAGCPGSSGMLRLSPLSAVPGTQGGALSLRLSNVPAAPGTALFALGLSRNKWNSLSLPWTMTILGAPSCSLWAAPEVLLGAPVSGSVADLTLQVPPNSGFEFHLQGVVLDPGVSRGFSVSHGATIIGQ